MFKEYEELKKKIEEVELNPEDLMYPDFEKDQERLKVLEKLIQENPITILENQKKEYEELKKKIEEVELNPEDLMYPEFEKDQERLKELEKLIQENPSISIQKNTDQNTNNESKPDNSQENHKRKIQEFTNNIVNQINNLPASEREQALKDLEIKKDSIEGIELSDEEIEEIKNNIYSQVDLQTDEKIERDMENLVFIQVMAIEKMTLPEIESELVRVNHLSYEKFDEINLTPQEFKVYKRLWMQALRDGRNNELTAMLFEEKNKIKTFENIKSLEFTDEEFKNVGIEEQDFEYARAKLAKKVEKVSQDYKNNLIRINAIPKIGEKINAIVNPKNVGYNYVKVMVKGYILSNGIEQKEFRSTEETLAFVKNNNDYELKEYIVTKLGKEIYVNANLTQKIPQKVKKIKSKKTVSKSKKNMFQNALNTVLNGIKRLNDLAKSKKVNPKDVECFGDDFDLGFIEYLNKPVQDLNSGETFLITNMNLINEEEQVLTISDPTEAYNLISKKGFMLDSLIGEKAGRKKELYPEEIKLISSQSQENTEDNNKTNNQVLTQAQIDQLIYALRQQQLNSTFNSSQFTSDDVEKRVRR